MRKAALTIAIQIARAAGDIIVRAMPRLTSIRAEAKGTFDYTSEVDKAAEAEIVREIKRSFPGHAILAEESGARGNSPYCWIVDPLDGTHNFLRGFPHFCVSIAQTEHGEPVVGVIYDPIRDEIFAASKGSGATLNDRRIRVSQRLNIDGALLCTGFPFRERQHIVEHLAQTRLMLERAEDIRRTGSAALDLAYIAAGRLDGYWEAGLKPWDMAAGALLVREAGGRCTDFSGQPGFIDSGRIVAANIKVGDDMLASIKAAATETHGATGPVAPEARPD